MNRLHLERILWSIAGVAACATIFRLRSGSATDSHLTQLSAVAPQPQWIAADALEEAVGEITEGHLFRPERAMAEEGEASSTSPTLTLMPSSPPQRRPRLVLRGVLGGPPWDAVIEGIPGREGAVVMRAGQTLAGVTVRAVHRDTVLARGFDTTWTLTLGRSW
jgi:hypothetical protein